MPKGFWLGLWTNYRPFWGAFTFGWAARLVCYHIGMGFDGWVVGFLVMIGTLAVIETRPSN
jgi:hypothetical protein